MKSNTVIWIGVGCSIVVMLLWYFSRYVRPNHFNWNEEYAVNNEEPFSTSVLADITKTYFPNNAFDIVRDNIKTVLDTTYTGGKNYFFAGETCYMSDSTVQELLDFVARGNNAFIAAKYFSDDFANEIFYSYDFVHTDTSDYIVMDESIDETISDSTIILQNNISNYRAQYINVNFTAPEFKHASGYTYIFQIMDVYSSYNWRYFSEEFLNSSTKYSMQPLGTMNNGGYNFIRVQHKEGNIYISTTPVLLTNFFLIHEDNLEYTSKLLSHLTAGDIIWDEYSKRDHTFEYAHGQEEGPLKFILSQPSLRWAWYLLIAGILLFILFRGKRMQQIIQVTEPNINRSLEFVQTIGRMYYMSKDKKQLIRQKMKLLHYFIKDKYKLPSAEITEDFINKLSLKSQIPESDLKYIFNTYQYLEKQFEITDKELIDFHHITDTFYKTCK